MATSSKSKESTLESQLRRKSSRFAFELLEPRVMLSADPLPLSEDVISKDNSGSNDYLDEADTLLISSSLTPSSSFPSPLVSEEFQTLKDADLFLPTTEVPQNHVATELIFIDGGVEDIDELLELIDTSAEGTEYFIYELNQTESGLKQISERLANHSQIDAVHILSHGSGEGLQLGSDWVTQNTLKENSNLLESWGESLDEHADLLLYGCDLAASPSGLSFIHTLQSLTQTDIAASNDLTGNSISQGDWELEYQLGEINHALMLDTSHDNQWLGTLAVYDVTTTDDVIDAGDGLLSLREAVIAANANAGADTINLSAGTYTLSIASGGTDESKEHLNITDSLSIVGAGTGLTFIDGGNNFKIAEYEATAIINSLSDLTLQNGSESGNAGAIEISDAATSLTITDVEIVDSTSSSRGGAIHNSGTLVLEGVTLAGNTGQFGGAIYNEASGNLTAINSTLSGNSAQFGGGIYSEGTVSLTNVTVTNNVANNSGGGIDIFAGTVTLSNSIVAGNTAVTSSPDVLGDFTSDGNNVIGDASGATGFGSDLIGDPNLDVLADNGGETRTHALLTGSIAIDAGTDTGAPADDQRGVARINTDIGSYEVVTNQEPTLSITSLNPSFTEGGSAEALFNSASADTVDVGQTFEELGLTVTNVTDGSDELISINGVLIALTHLNTGTVSGFTYNVTLSGTTATLVLSSGNVNNAAMNTLLNSLSYQNTSQDPTAATRRITLDYIQDDGGSGGDSDNRLDLSDFSDISVNAENDLAVIGNKTLTLSQGDTVVIDASHLSATDVDNSDLSLRFDITNVSNGYFALTSDTNTAITSFTQAQISSSSVVFIHDGGELAPAFDLSVYDGTGSSAVESASVNFTDTSDGVLWASIDGDEGSGNGIPGLDGSNVDKGDVLQQAGPDFALGEAGTDGTFSVAFDISQFSSQDDTNGLHYVTSSVSIGLINPIVLQAGDLILSSSQDMTLTSNGVASPADLDITKEDIFYFRPDTAGDYSSGNFYLLLSDPFQDGAEITGLSLVEQDVWIGDYQLKEGDLLLSRDGGSEESDIWLLKTDTLDTALPSSYPAALQLINGEDSNVDIDGKIYGIDLLESDQVIGGQSYDAGTIFLSFDNDDNDGVGVTNQLVERNDIVALSVTKTTLGAGLGNASATAALLFDGNDPSDNDVNFDTGNETIDGFSFTHDSSGVNNPPTLNTNSFSLIEGASVTVTSAMLSATDSDNADAGLSYDFSSILGGEFQLTTNLGVTVTTVTQNQIDNNEVIFIDNGDETAPSFSFTVSDGTNTTSITSAVITFTSLNDEPTLSLTASNPTFTEGGSAASLYSGSNASTIESGETFIGLTFTVTNVTDGASEVLNIDGKAIGLTNGNSGSSTGFSYSVSVSGTTATVTLSAGTATEAQMNALLDSMSYQNNDADPTTANRVITLAALQDSGGIANSGDDSLAPNIASTVTVLSVNDLPAVAANNLVVNQGQTLIVTNSHLSATDADDLNASVVFVINSISGGSFENIAFPGVEVVSFTQAQVTAGQIQFVDDNDSVAPIFNFSLDDGKGVSGPFYGLVSFTETVVSEEPVLDEPVVDELIPEEVVLEEALSPEIVIESDDEVEQVDEEPEAETETVIQPEVVDNNTTSSLIAESSTAKPLTPADVVFDQSLPDTEPKKISIVVAESVASVSQLKVSWAALADPLLLIKSDRFMDSLSNLDDDMQKTISLDAMVLGSGAAISTGLSVGYVAWLLRSGIILTSVLSSLPAWRFIDPLPVLSRMGDQVEEGESLEDMVSSEDTSNETGHRTDNDPDINK